MKMKFISTNDIKWIWKLPPVCLRSAATLATTSMKNVPSTWPPLPQRCYEVLQRCFYPKARWNLLDSKAAVQLHLHRVPSICRSCHHSLAAAFLTTSKICTVTIRWALPNRFSQTHHRRATAKAVFFARITTPICVKSLAKRQRLDFPARTKRTLVRIATRCAIASTRSCLWALTNWTLTLWRPKDRFLLIPELFVGVESLFIFWGFFCGDYVPHKYPYWAGPMRCITVACRIQYNNIHWLDVFSLFKTHCVRK